MAIYADDAGTLVIWTTAGRGGETEGRGGSGERRSRNERKTRTGKKLLSTWPKRNSYKNAMRHVSNLVSLQEEAEEGATKRHAAERWRVHGV